MNICFHTERARIFFHINILWHKDSIIKGNLWREYILKLLIYRQLLPFSSFWLYGTYELLASITLIFLRNWYQWYVYRFRKPAYPNFNKLFDPKNYHRAGHANTHTHTHTHMLRAVSNIIHESRLTPQKCEINKNVSNCIEQLINSKMTFKTTAALLYM